MRVIPPLDITSARLTSSNIPDVPSGSTAWSSGASYTAGAIVSQASTNSFYRALIDISNSTIEPKDSILSTQPVWVEIGSNLWVAGTYSPGQKVLRTTTNKIYQCLVSTSAVTSLTPETLSSGGVIYWLEVGPSNKWAMFDYLRNSSTKAATTITVRLTPGTRFDSVALVGLRNVRSVTIKAGPLATIDTTPLYTITRTLTDRASLGFYDYFYDPVSFAKSAVFFGLPVNSAYVIDVTLTGSNIECGGLVVGFSEFIGTLQRGASNDVTNFSSVTRDVFGNAAMIPRRNVPKTSQQLFLPAESVNTVRKLRDSLNALPAVWVGLDDLPDQYYFESLLIVGFYKTFRISIDNNIGVIVDLELEEI